ncbi:hypothetical protein [Mesorhizobium captivum]|uniref:hypothetical protein n=1 Tax=Mesorhizobium captivum TaxID=3072319 RepID=UPI002A24D0C6|nr:hypothetical protein [Mesorhizobium sp. VK22E]MDX8510176.1 hypothetical protein [Mesorhizobium sp. VK22E]
MADSDNTTTLPFVTRRRVLAGTAIAIAGSQRNAFARNDLEKNQPTDPAVALWRKWKASHEQTERLCRQQQRLERKLVETVGFPSATIRLRDDRRVTLHSLKALHEVLDLDPEDVALRVKAEADLADHQARWDAADREIGYSATLRAERDAADRAEDLLEALSKTPAASLAGVAAKLDAALREAEISEDQAEFPWPQIRSALDDVIRNGQRLVPEQMFPNDMLQPAPLRKRRGDILRFWIESDGGVA